MFEKISTLKNFLLIILIFLSFLSPHSEFELEIELELERELEMKLVLELEMERN
jgi:hypothetical protein